jgi:hypothetical protein
MKRPSLKECPPGESFVRYFSGELEESEGDRLLEHAARCPYCKVRLNALASLQNELEARKKDLPEASLSSQDQIAFRRMARAQARAGLRKGPTVFPRMIRAGGILAAGLILAIAGYRLFVKISVPEPVMRGSGREEIRLHQPEGIISEAPKIFSWSKVKDSDGYRLDIVDDNLNLIFSKGLAGTRLRLPEDVRQRLEHQKPYLWTVSAYDEDDQEMASASGYFEIE